jgi:uncharacterized protein YbaP (TraB family)
MKRRLVLLAVAWLACSSGPVPIEAQPAPAPTSASWPLLWRADPPAEGAGPLFLLGSVHVGTPQMLDLGPAIAEAFAESDELVVEVDLSQVTESQIEELTQRYGVLPAGQTLKDRVSEATHELLVHYLERRGMAPDSMSRFKPWFVAYIIIQLEFQAAGYDPALGVDQIFLDQAQGRKPIVGLETISSQLATMDELPAPIQDLMLKDALARIEDLVQETRDLLAAWQRGDEDELVRLVFSPLREFPELDVFYERVFFRRNGEMSARLEALSRDGKTRFVVLGAGHMVGEHGIPALLTSRGFRVREVDGSKASALPFEEPLDQPGRPRGHAGLDQRLGLVVGAPGAVEGGVDAPRLAHQ